jgi:hypothetical protein
MSESRRLGDQPWWVKVVVVVAVFELIGAAISLLTFLAFDVAPESPRSLASALLSCPVRMEGVTSESAARLGKGDRWLARFVALATVAGVGVALWQGITANQQATEANEKATEALDASILPLLVEARGARRVTTAACGDPGAVCIEKGFDTTPAHFPQEFLRVSVRNIGAGAARITGAEMTLTGSPRPAHNPPIFIASREQASFRFLLKNFEAAMPGGVSMVYNSDVTVEVEYTNVAGRERQKTTLHLQDLRVEDIDLSGVRDERVPGGQASGLGTKWLRPGSCTVCAQRDE